MESIQNTDIPVMSKRISIRKKLQKQAMDEESQSSSLKLTLKKSSIAIKKEKMVLPPIVHDKSKVNNIDKMTNALLSQNQVLTRQQSNMKMNKQPSINTMFMQKLTVRGKDENLLSDSNMDGVSSNTTNHQFLGTMQNFGAMEGLSPSKPPLAKLKSKTPLHSKMKANT